MRLLDVERSMEQHERRGVHVPTRRMHSACSDVPRLHGIWRVFVGQAPEVSAGWCRVRVLDNRIPLNTSECLRMPPQGMNLIKSASEHFEWNVDLGECARIWKGGCIIRAAFLDDIKRAYVRNPKLANLLVDPDFAEQLLERQTAWRRVVTLCLSSGIAAPAMTASLSYFDSYRRARLPANLVQVKTNSLSCCPNSNGQLRYL